MQSTSHSPVFVVYQNMYRSSIYTTNYGVYMFSHLLIMFSLLLIVYTFPERKCCGSLPPPCQHTRRYSYPSPYKTYIVELYILTNLGRISRGQKDGHCNSYVLKHIAFDCRHALFCSHTQVPAKILICVSIIIVQ